MCEKQVDFDRSVFLFILSSNHHHHFALSLSLKKEKNSKSCVSLQVLEGDPEAYHRKTLTKVLLEKKKSWLAHEDVSIVVDVRGVSVSLSCRRRVPRVQTQHVPTSLRPLPPFLPHSITSPLLFLFIVVRGAVLTGTAFFFIHCIHIDPAQSKKHSLSKNIAWSVCIVTLPVFLSAVVRRTPGRKLPQGGYTHLVKRPFYLQSDDARYIA